MLLSLRASYFVLRTPCSMLHVAYNLPVFIGDGATCEVISERAISESARQTPDDSARKLLDVDVELSGRALSSPLVENWLS